MTEDNDLIESRRWTIGFIPSNEPFVGVNVSDAPGSFHTQRWNQEKLRVNVAHLQSENKRVWAVNMELRKENVLLRVKLDKLEKEWIEHALG